MDHEHVEYVFKADFALFFPVFCIIALSRPYFKREIRNAIKLPRSPFRHVEDMTILSLITKI